MKARCGKCRHVFEYEPALVEGRPRTRHVCDECRRSRKNFLTKQSNTLIRRPLKKGAAEARAVSNEYEARQKIGKVLGLDQSTVAIVERTALAKIRRSPELREAFAHYAEAGMPRVAELIGSLAAPDREAERAALLLEYQMQVMDFWTVYEGLVAEAAKLDADPKPYADLPLWQQRRRQGWASVKAEREEILREIASIQKTLKAELLCPT